MSADRKKVLIFLNKRKRPTPFNVFYAAIQYVPSGVLTKLCNDGLVKRVKVTSKKSGKQYANYQITEQGIIVAERLKSEVQ